MPLIALRISHMDATSPTRSSGMKISEVRFASEPEENKVQTCPRAFRSRFFESRRPSNSAVDPRGTKRLACSFTR